MKVELHRWNSPHLGRDLELKSYGEAGKPVLVFPCANGRYHEFEDFGMVEACRPLLEAGRIRIYAVDSVDGEAWLNHVAHPADRGRRHEAFDRYVVQEVVPFIRARAARADGVLAAGCSLGGYHAVNFFLRHPDVFDAAVSLSGVFRLAHFVGDYADDGVYFNSPILYLPGLSDPWYLDRIRAGRLVICTGQGAWETEAIEDARSMQGILRAKAIPAWVDFWGVDVCHDWHWWRRQLPYFLDRLDVR